jgi:glycerol-3-phosphate O-acyltransferase / dihydroxyacetone phosphate acyltransferase
VDRQENVLTLLDRVAAAVAHLFYRVDRVGSPPSTGPLLLLPNHPNALLDPTLVMATAGRRVRFLAKSTLFQTPFRPILHAAGAIPVFRRQDEGVDPSKNAETFAAVDNALREGEGICLFPEGISHSTGRLEPLRTGAARMALSAAAKGIDVQLVAVGINPDRKTDFRSRMTVVYGQSFGVPPGSTVASLTTAIAQRMRGLIVEADPEADAALVRRVEKLYSSERHVDGNLLALVERRRLIASGVQRLRESDPTSYEAALLQLRRYDERMRRFGLRDRALDWSPSRAEAIRFLGRELPLAIVLVPLAILAVLVFAVPYLLTAAVGRRPTDSDTTATVKVVAGTIFYLAWVAAAAALAWSIFGAVAGVAAVLVLPALGVAGLFAIEREQAAWRTARSWLALRGTHPNTRQRLRRHRAELADVLDKVNAMLTGDPSAVDRP